MRLLLGPILALLAWQAAASPDLPPGSLRFRHLNVTQNLSMEFVRSMVQDRQGYLWIAEGGGLYRYDGHRTKYFRSNPSDPSGLAHNTIRRLFVDPQGTLWIGTRAGLQHYDPATESFVLHRQKGVTPASLALQARAITADGKGGLWLGTGEGLWHLVPGATPAADRYARIDFAVDKDSPRTQDILAIVQDRKGRLWIARTGDVVRYDPVDGSTRRFGQNRCHRPAKLVEATQSRSLLMDGDLLWFGTSSGLERWDISADDAPCTSLGKAADLANKHVVTMLKDRDNDIWMAVDGTGLVRWRRADGGTDTFGHSDGDPHSIGDNLIQSLAQDRSGTLWVGSLGSGVDYVDLASGGFRRLTNKKEAHDNLSSNHITTIGRLHDGRITIATLDAGVNLLDATSGKIVNLQPLPAETVARLNNGGVFGLAEDRKHRIWATTEFGLHRYDARSKRFDAPRSLTSAGSSAYIFGLHSDPDGMLWGATREGVRRVDPDTGKVTTFRHDPARPDSLSSDRVGALLRDHLGMEWAATSSGVDILDPATGRVRHLVHPRFTESINALFEDRRGDVWLAMSSGLMQVHRNGERFELAHHPLPVEADSILEADDGQLWVGTERNLLTYNPQTRAFVEYTGADGLSDGSFRANSARRMPDGTMYFGSFHGGVTIFQPAAIRRNTVAPAAAITGLVVDNRPLEPRSLPEGVHLEARPGTVHRLTLSPRQSTFAIEFSAMHYSDPERNTYAYRMLGYDDKWTRTAASKPFALYGSLPPGEYRFQVMAANKNGVWSPAAAELRVEVTPAIWATPWFRALAVLLLATLLWLMYRMRVRMLIRKQAQLETVVAQRTAQVRDTLRELTATQEQLVFREKMASVGTLTAGIAHEINNPANFAHVGAQLLATDLQHFHELLRELAGEDAEAEVMQTIEDQFATLSARIATIADGTTRIRDLVKDLRTFARLDEAEKKEVDLIQSLQSTIQLVRPQYANVVDFVTAFGAHPRLECWPAQLNQVFMNVIVNACQAIEARQRQDDAAPPGRLTIRSREEGDWCVLEFEDNGCGIAPGVLDRIFEPFFTTKDVGSGTGLGLSISFGIVAKHRGAIEARSTPGHGSCFTIRLPMTTTAQMA
jgi:signal transduction histidine kinase/ligand-binding sensor domain-containing protein